MQFISVAEVAGGPGLLLRGLVRVRRELTPIAVSGLILIMTGAVTVSTLHVSIGAAVMPLVVCVLLVAVLRGHWGWMASLA